MKVIAIEILERILVLLLGFLVIVLVTRSVLASPVDDLNLTDIQKEEFCNTFNLSMFECVDFWILLDKYEVEQCNFTGWMNESECFNVTTIVNQTCETDDALAYYDAMKERGICVEPVFLQGEITNWQKCSFDSSSSDVSCSEKILEDEYNRGRISCLTLPNSNSIADDVRSGEKANPLYIWVGLILVGLVVIWKMGFLKRFNKGNSSVVFPSSSIPPSAPVLDELKGFSFPS